MELSPGELVTLEEYRTHILALEARMNQFRPMIQKLPVVSNKSLNLTPQSGEN